MTPSRRSPDPPSPRVRPGPQPLDESVRAVRRGHLMFASLLASGWLLLRLGEPDSSWFTIAGISFLAVGAVGLLVFYVRLQRRLRRTSPVDDVAGRALRRFAVTFVPIGALGALLLGVGQIAPPWVAVVGIVCLVICLAGLVLLIVGPKRLRPGGAAQASQTGQIR